MSVTAVTKLDDRHASITKGESRYTHNYHVECSDRTDDEAMAVAAVPVEIGDAHPTDDQAHCSSIDADFDAATTLAGGVGCVYKVTVEYSTKQDSNEGGGEGAIADATWKVSWGGDGISVELPHDAAGKPVVNSSGEPFEQGLARILPMKTATAHKIVGPTFSIADVDGLAWTVNDTAFTIDGYTVAIGRGLLHPIQLSEVKEETIGPTTFTFREIAIQIDILNASDEDGVQTRWDDFPVPDLGLQKLADGKRTPIMYKGVQVERPFPLDGAGQPLEDATDTPEILHFKPYQLGDWSMLDLI